MSEQTSPATGFKDLLAANRTYAETFGYGGFDGIARAGVLMLTCMDSRIDPLRMLGLQAGDAKILRNAGARLTDAALEGVVLGVNLLEVTRVLIVPHTQCAVASNTEADIKARVSAAAGQSVDDYRFHVVADQLAAVRADVLTLRDHPLIPATTAIGGFLYDVDTGLLTQVG
ncbi:MAG: carbonic anhydrase [Lapillicoccus sp.]